MVEKNYYKNKKNRCFIVGTGNSLNDIDMSLLENEITISLILYYLKPILHPIIYVYRIQQF